MVAIRDHTPGIRSPAYIVPSMWPPKNIAKKIQPVGKFQEETPTHAMQEKPTRMPAYFWDLSHDETVRVTELGTFGIFQFFQ